MYQGVALTTIAAVVLVTARLAGQHTIAAAAKMTASTGFLWTAYLVAPNSASSYGLAVAVGLMLGWFGDLFLIPRNSNRMFLAGLVSFLGGHVAYIVAIGLHGFSPRIAALGLGILAPAGLLFYRWLRFSGASTIRYGAMAYVLIITIMLAAGAATWGVGSFQWIVPGALLFYASDIGVALDRFKPGRIPAYVWSLPLYYAGQTGFALSMGFAP